MLFTLAPDPQSALISFLTSHADVSAISGTRVSSSKIDTKLPRIQVSVVPGDTTMPWEEATEFQVDCWGGTEKQALDLARTVCNAIPEMQLLQAAVTQSYVTVRPFASHDPTTGRPRFICQAQIVLSPEATP